MNFFSFLVPLTSCPFAIRRLSNRSNIVFDLSIVTKIKHHIAMNQMHRNHTLFDEEMKNFPGKFYLYNRTKTIFHILFIASRAKKR